VLALLLKHQSKNTCREARDGQAGAEELSAGHGEATAATRADGEAARAPGKGKCFNKSQAGTRQVYNLQPEESE